MDLIYPVTALWPINLSTPTHMLLFAKALRFSAVLVLSLLFLTVTPTDADALETNCSFWPVVSGGQCFVAWVCDSGGGFSYTDPEFCGL